jgi:hypothetical protein
MLPERGGDSHDDWLRCQGLLPGINLDRIRFGRRVEKRPKIAITFMGQPLPGQEKQSSKLKREKGHDPGYELFQLRLW